MIKNVITICPLIISLFYYNQSLASSGECKRSCNNEFKACMISQSITSSSHFISHVKLKSFNAYTDKEVRAFMKLQEMSKIDSKKIVYSNKEAYVEVTYLLKGSDKKYGKKISWYEFCKEDYQLCIKKC